MDQPYRLLERLQVVHNVYDAVTAYNQHWPEPGWIESNPEVFKVVTAYWSLRENVKLTSVV